MSQAESKEGFIPMGSVPKDTFLTKLDGDTDTMSEDSNLFPITTLPSTTKLLKFLIKIGKFLVLSSLIGGLVITLSSFHTRLSNLELRFQELEMSSHHPLQSSTNLLRVSVLMSFPFNSINVIWKGAGGFVTKGQNRLPLDRFLLSF